MLWGHPLIVFCVLLAAACGRSSPPRQALVQKSEMTISLGGRGQPGELDEDVCPKRFGLNYEPPSIVLEYLQISTGKLFHRHIGLRRLKATSDPARVAEKLRLKNRALLGEDKVSFEQIVTLVSKLQESLAGKPEQQLTKKAQPTTAAAAVASVAATSSTATATATAVSVSAASKVATTEDSAARTALPAVATVKATAVVAKPASAAAPASSPADTGSKAGQEEDLANKNLNALDDAELAKHKARMDVVFFQNQKKPGDDGYIYDVQVDFPEGDAPCGWDSEEDSIEAD